MAETTTVPVQNGSGQLARHQPFDTFERMRDEMERFFGEAWPWSRMRLPKQMELGTAWAPRVDVFDKNGDLVVKAELPGLERKDIQVSYDRGDLEIRGEKKAESEVKDEDYYRMERSYGSFYRRMTLPFEVQPDKIKAEYKDGVLQVSIPKPAEAKPEPKKIAVG
jgi:HSP20 family protein